MLYTIFKNIFKFIFYLFNRYTVIGRKNIPSSGPVLVVSNHVSYWDPMVLGAGVPRKVHFMAKEELFKVPVVGLMITTWGAFKVKRGRSDREAIEKSLEVLKQGKVMGIFIEGTRNRKNPDKMLKPQHGAAMLALRSGAPVVPAVLINSHKILRSFRRVKVIYGQPIVFTEEPGLEKKDLYQKISNRIVEEITQLKTAHQNRKNIQR